MADSHDCQTMSVPEAGKAFGLGRNASYEAAKRGEIQTLRFGRLLRVSKAWLRSVLNRGEVNDSERSKANGR